VGAVLSAKLVVLFKSLELAEPEKDLWGVLANNWASIFDPKPGSAPGSDRTVPG